MDAVPDLAVGPHGRGRDRARLRVERRDGSRAEVVAVQAMPPGDELEQQQRRAVGPPVDGLDGTLEVERQVHELARSRVPGRRASLAGALVGDRHPRVAGNGRKPEPGQLQAFVAQLRDGRAGHGVDRPQRRVEHVAVLHDLEHRERVVARQRPPVDRAGQPPAAGEPDGLRVLVDAARDAAVLGRPDREALLGAQPATERVRPIARPSGQPFGRPSIRGSGPVRSSYGAIT